MTSRILVKLYMINTVFILRFENFSQDTSFSIIFKPELNRRELDLVADTKEIRDIWVDAISHTLATLSSLTHQKEYE